MGSTDTSRGGLFPRLTHVAGRHASESVCFAAGTRIATAQGAKAIETLVPGDLAVTASGALRPIRWLGHRRVDCSRHPRPDRVLPVRIAAHAFGEARPSRDLLVSPGHALCVDADGEILVPARALANGVTIARVVVDTIDYWHVELDGHDLLLAENLAAESYLDTGGRDFFVESSVVAIGEITPDASPATRLESCRPFHEDGPRVEAARRRLAQRAERLSKRDAVAVA